MTGPLQIHRTVDIWIESARILMESCDASSKPCMWQSIEHSTNGRVYQDAEPAHPRCVTALAFVGGDASGKVQGAIRLGSQSVPSS